MARRVDATRLFPAPAQRRTERPSGTPLISRPRPARQTPHRLTCPGQMDAFLGIKPKELKASAAEPSSSRTSPSKQARKAGAGASTGGPALEASIPWVER